MQEILRESFTAIQNFPECHLARGHGDDERQRGTGCTGLGGGEQAEEQAAHDEYEDDDHLDGTGQGCELFLEGCLGTGRTPVGMATAEIPDRSEEQQRQQNAGDHAAHEQHGDGLAGLEADDDKHDRGRDDHAERRACCNRACGQDRVVSEFLHFRQGHGGHGCRSGRVGAADGRESGAGEDGGHGDAALDFTHPCVG